MLGQVPSLVRYQLAAAYTSQAHEVANSHEREQNTEPRCEEQLRKKQLTDEKELQVNDAQKESEHQDDSLCRSVPALIRCFLSHE